MRTNLDTYTPPAQSKQPIDAVFEAVETPPNVPKVSWLDRFKGAAVSLWSLRCVRVVCLVFGGIACAIFAALSIGFGLKFLWVVILGQTLTEGAAVLIVVTSLGVTVVLCGAAIELKF